MKKISLLGSTGSIGLSALNVVRHLQKELKIVAIAAHSNIDLLELQAKEFRPSLIAVRDPKSAAELRKRLPDFLIEEGIEGLCHVASFDEADFTLLGMSGIEGLKPALSAIEAKKQIGLANKEILVSAGELIIRLAKEKQVDLIPIDSEHSALFQCLHGGLRSEVRRMILTASGGPFLRYSTKLLEQVDVHQALKHPNWKMGSKITIDSSTLMNKGLELIEASHLFDLSYESLDVIVHPQSVIHSMVEFCDGSMLAQLSEPDMTLPIQYALTYPKRYPGLLKPFDFLNYPTLTFEKPDREKFLPLMLAERALREKGSYACALNAANEVLVKNFLAKKSSWIAIGQKLEKLMSSHTSFDLLTLESVVAVDKEFRQRAEEF